MFAKHESRDDQEFIFEIAAADVARACIDVLNQLGTVKKISKETGIINGEVSNGITNPSVTTIRISQISENKTKLIVKMVRREGLITPRIGAQDNMARFASVLYQHPDIKGKTISGW